MELSAIYNRVNFLAIPFIFLLASIVCYFLVRSITFGQVDETLQMEKTRILTFTARYHHLPEIIPVKDQLIQFLPTTGYQQPFFRTENDFDIAGNDTSQFRKIYFSVRMKNQWNQAIVGRSMENTRNLFKSIIAVIIGMILLILVVYYIINSLVLNKLWQPFYNGLNLMKEYEVGKEHPAFPDSNIDEFAFMNSVLQQATIRADREYQVLKEFTENASHEMQTPLTIIRSKLDLLIQNRNIAEEYSDNLQAVYMAIQKLSNLNRSLLLLSKIDNNQFTETTDINLREKVVEKISQFQEILYDKKVSIRSDLEDVQVKMNSDLCDFLLIFCFSAIFISPSTQAQNISGMWQGKLTQEPGGCFPEYFIELQIQADHGDIAGISYDYYDTTKFVKLSFWGTASGGGKKLIRLAEKTILKQQIPEDCIPCMKTYDLTYSRQNNIESLSGKWVGEDIGTIAGCPPGDIFLKRVTKSAITEKNSAILIICGKQPSSDS